MVAGAIAGGLQPGTFAVHVEGGRITVQPCDPARGPVVVRASAKLDALMAEDA